MSGQNVITSGDFVYFIIPSDTKQNFEGTLTNPAWGPGSSLQGRLYKWARFFIKD